MNPNTLKEFSRVFTCYSVWLLVLILGKGSLSRKRLAASYGSCLGFFITTLLLSPTLLYFHIFAYFHSGRQSNLYLYLHGFNKLFSSVGRSHSMKISQSCFEYSSYAYLQLILKTGCPGKFGQDFLKAFGKLQSTKPALRWRKTNLRSYSQRFFCLWQALVGDQHYIPPAVVEQVQSLVFLHSKSLKIKINATEEFQDIFQVIV